MQMGERWNISHIKGHQTGATLTRQAELNNHADHLATQARHALPWNHRNLPSPQYPACAIHITIDDKLITQGI
eukprot:14381945-Ditylum_brightwellii.AAC.1